MAGSAAAQMCGNTTATWTVKANIAAGGNCTDGITAIGNKMYFLTCEPKSYCDAAAGKLGKCKVAPVYGAACTKAADCAIPAGAPFRQLHCAAANATNPNATKTCHYMSPLGDSCMDNADCAVGTCMDKVCKGGVAAGGDCSGAKMGSCMNGLYCKAGTNNGTATHKCAAKGADGAACAAAAAGADCTSGMCNTETMKCASEFSLDAGTKASFPLLCKSGYTNAAKVCATTRTNATVATGGMCTKMDSSQCKQATDVCVCKGAQKGTCTAFIKPDIATLAKAAEDCAASSGCASEEVAPGTCLEEKCGDKIMAYQCAFAEATLAASGAPSDAFDNIKEEYGCTAHGSGSGPGTPGKGLSTGVIIAIIAGAVVVLGGAAYCCTRKKKDDTFSEIDGGSGSYTRA
uniref:Uncharacterized protein n=1 Tax=Bicosoecida sp. CB-2014 TaxID=1486930 RepID=A0A7S1C668_9STRA